MQGPGQSAEVARSIPAYAGKTTPEMTWPTVANGPSPRMRGKRPHCGGEDRAGRSIPAYAGKTTGPARNSCTASGPSPRMRGKRRRAPAEGRDPRSIPAYAGKTPKQGPGGRADAVHPRVCGENYDVSEFRELDLGPSPRMRGKRRFRPGRPEGHRSIPAYAGKTLFLSAITSVPPVHPRVCGENGAHRGGAEPHAVHPRVCGENPLARSQPSSRFGPSPRMRGKPGAGGVPEEQHRSIPAYAGKTFQALPVSFSRRGPSPRMRGKQAEAIQGGGGLRSIPAYAGKTSAPAPRARRRTVHPRVCGENSDRWMRAFEDAGPSPRMRGKRHLLVGRVLRGLVHPRVCGENVERLEKKPPVERSIPAYAGKTS